MDTGVACYCYGDSTCGQRVFYQFGMTQIPIYNVNNNCSTGSTGLHLGRTMISGGMADAVQEVSPHAFLTVLKTSAINLSILANCSQRIKSGTVLLDGVVWLQVVQLVVS